MSGKPLILLKIRYELLRGLIRGREKGLDRILTAALNKASLINQHSVCSYQDCGNFIIT